MGRTVGKLTALGVNKAKEPGYYGDGGGLYLQISKARTKSWIFRYVRAGRERQIGLGPLHTVTLAQAREHARGCRSILLSGCDPLELRKAEQLENALERAKMVTFDDCAASYVAAHRSSWKNKKHAAQWESTLEMYASPVIGKLPVAKVDTALVVKVLQPIWQDKADTAIRLRGRIESILDWATVSRFRVGDNPARWRGHLDHLLADPNRVARVTHHPALPWQEIGNFMAELREREGVPRVLSNSGS